MDAYSFDENGYYTGIVQRQLDPLATREQGQPVYGVPARAAVTPPPSFDSESQVAKWDGSAWSILPKPEPPKAKNWFIKNQAGQLFHSGIEKPTEDAVEVPDELLDEELLDVLEVVDGSLRINEVKKIQKDAAKEAARVEEEARLSAEALAKAARDGRVAEINSLKSNVAVLTLPEVKTLLVKVIEELGL